MHVLANLVAESDGGGSGAAGLVQIGILLLIPLAMYFLMIRPQRRRMREQQALQASLEVGDEVMTASGIYGFITGFEDDRVWIEIDDDVQIRVNRSFLQGKVAEDTAPAGRPAKASSSTSVASNAPTTSSPSSKVTPTVKGVRSGRGSKANTADESADGTAEPADRSTRE